MMHHDQKRMRFVDVWDIMSSLTANNYQGCQNVWAAGGIAGFFCSLLLLSKISQVKREKDMRNGQGPTAIYHDHKFPLNAIFFRQPAKLYVLMKITPFLCSCWQWPSHCLFLVFSRSKLMSIRILVWTTELLT